jgi:hypothetical protein
MPDIGRVAYLKQQAAYFRELADQAKTPEFKTAFLEMAAEYDRLACNAERHLASTVREVPE